MNISVVIPSYNAQANLSATLNAIQSQEMSCTAETIVVDCSDHDAVAKICARIPNVTYHHVSERFNPGEGRNIGANIAKGELLVFVDADVILEKHALNNAWLFFQKGSHIFGGALELNEDVCATPAAYLEHYFFNHESQKGRPICKRSNLSSALMMFDRQLFLGNGGFKDIPRMQDTELTERLLKQGQELLFTPSVLGYQIQDSSMKKVLRKIFIGGNNLYFIRYQKSALPKKIVLFLCLPAIALLKIARIFIRHMRYQTTRQRLKTLRISPLLIIAGSYWMAGLYRSMIFSDGISQHRD